MIDAIEGNSVCTNRRKIVSYETFNPFRTSLGCQYAKDVERVPQAVPITADARCYNGLFTSGTEGTITVTLGVDGATSPHHIELDDCGFALEVAVASGTTPPGDLSLRFF